MKILSSEGDCFEFKIIGYQYPNIVDDYWDSNWLLIKIDVIHGGKTWSAVDACLTTFEVARLAFWLKNIQFTDKRKPTCSFTEPNLTFHVVQSNSIEYLRIFFELKFRPPWAYSNIAGLEDLWIDFALADINPLTIAQELLTQLQNYPQRVFR